MFEEGKYYKESGKFNPLGAVLITLSVTALGIVLFLLYLLFNNWCTLIYLNMIAAFVAAAAMGWLVSRIAGIFKIRNKTVVIVCAVIGFLIASYVKWAMYDYLDVKKYRYNNMKEESAESYYAFDVYFGYDVDTQAMIDTYKEIKEDDFLNLYTGGTIDYSELGFSDDDIDRAHTETVWKYNDFDKLLGKSASEVEKSLEKAKDMDAYEFTFDYRKSEPKKTVMHLLVSPKELWSDIGEINRVGRWSLRSSSYSVDKEKSDNVTGVFLWLTWLGEFIGMGASFLALVWRSFEAPFIESEDNWAVRKGYSPKKFYAPDDLNEFKRSLEMSEFNLFDLEIPQGQQPAKYLSVEIWNSRALDENYMNVYQITITQKGKNTNTAKKQIIKLLRVSKEFVLSDKLF